MIRRLEGDGLVERQADPRDGRATLIYLTARSREFEPVAEAALAELDRLVRKRLSAEQVRELKGALRELIELG
jgi:DNA-binding MarR family transcriptional regulator